MCLLGYSRYNQQHQAIDLDPTFARRQVASDRRSAAAINLHSSEITIGVTSVVRTATSAGLSCPARLPRHCNSLPLLSALGLERNLATNLPSFLAKPTDSQSVESTPNEQLSAVGHSPSIRRASSLPASIIETQLKYADVTIHGQQPSAPTAERTTVPVPHFQDMTVHPEQSSTPDSESTTTPHAHVPTFDSQTYTVPSVEALNFATRTFCYSRGFNSLPSLKSTMHHRSSLPVTSPIWSPEYSKYAFRRNSKEFQLHRYSRHYSDWNADWLVTVIRQSHHSDVTWASAGLENSVMGVMITGETCYKFLPTAVTDYWPDRSLDIRKNVYCLLLQACERDSTRFRNSLISDPTSMLQFLVGNICDW